MWQGTNVAGNPFELIGVNVTTHDDEGRIADSWVIYPYPDEYVSEAFLGDGTQISGMWGDETVCHR